jgi:NADH-quinone oxidoreductase subunit J
MNLALILFWIVAVFSVITALTVVLHPNPIRSALFLVLNFMGLAVVYLLLNAQVLAFLQILVYAGAVMVLFLFVIMLLNLGGETAKTDPLVGQRLVGLVLGLAMLTGLVYSINASIRPASGVASEGLTRVIEAEKAGVSQIQIIGWDLFTRYLYPFELTSLLLLVGVIGVILLTKRPTAVHGDAKS